MAGQRARRWSPPLPPAFRESDLTPAQRQARLADLLAAAARRWLARRGACIECRPHRETSPSRLDGAEDGRTDPSRRGPQPDLGGNGGDACL